MSRRPPSGFTLLELIVAVAIAAILLGVAVPSFVTVVRDAKIGETIDPVRRALLTARSEATRSRSNVTVCPRSSDTACGTNWNNGLLVFVDGVILGNETSATRDTTDELIAVIPPHETDNTLKAFASNDRTASGIYTPNFLRYAPDGRASWRSGYLLACDGERGEEHSRALNVTLTGSVQEARAGNAGVVLDVFGREIDCS